MNLFLLPILSSLTIYSFAQTIPMNSTWGLTGTSVTILESQNVENVELVFLENDVVQIQYDYSGEPTVETSSWTQIDANNFSMNFDPTGAFFGSNCPVEIMYVEYEIVDNALTMNTVTGDCQGAELILTGSVWINVDMASIQPISEVSYSMFPNPAKNQFSINGPFTNKVSISVFNLVGEKMNCSIAVTSSESLDISTKNLKAGTYFVQILEENQLVKSLSLIVE